MKKINLKEFYGELYTQKDHKHLGRIFALARIDRNIPEEMTIYFDRNSIDLSDSQYDLHHLLIIAEEIEVYCDFNKINVIDRIGGMSSSVIYADTKQILFVEEDKFLQIGNFIEGESEIIIRIANIEHLEYDLSSFRYDVTGELDNLNEITKKFEYYFENGFEEFKYQPGIMTIKTENNNDFILYFDHTFIFKIISNLPHFQFVKYLEESFELIGRTFNILTRFDFDFRSILVKRKYLGKKFKYELFRKEQVKNRGGGNIALSGKDFLKLIDAIIKRLHEMNEKEKFLYSVVTNRLTQIKRENDLSIQIAFLHLIFLHLVKEFYFDYIRLNNKNCIKKILMKINLPYDDHLIDVILKINYIRNKHFKDISYIERLDNSIFQTFDYFFENVFIKLFSKFLKLNDNDEKTLSLIMWNIYCFKQ